MKKFLSIIMVVVALLVGNMALPQTMPQASAQEYWGGDTNYPLLTSTAYFSWYLDSSSTVVKKNVLSDHCDRVWAVNVITVKKNSEKTFTNTYWFWDYCGTVYYSIDDGDWVEFDPTEGNKDFIDQVKSQACMLSWRIAFGSVF